MSALMYASAPTADRRWYAVRVCPVTGQIGGVIPGVFDSKVASDVNAKRELGLN